MRVLAVAGQKGGTGKTTVVLALADAWARAGRKVLAVDLDPQGNLALGLGWAARSDEQGHPLHVTDALAHGAPAGALLGVATSGGPDSEWPAGLAVVPGSAATGSLAGTPAQLRAAMLHALDGVGAWADVVVLDLPPGVGAALTTGLVAADGVLAVTATTGLALHGLVELAATVDHARAVNPGLREVGIVVNGLERRSVRDAERLVDLSEAFGDRVLAPTIPRRVVWRDICEAGVPPRRGRDGAEAQGIADTLAEKVWARLTAT